MIVNLVGHIASGKTTFAKWFIKNNPTYDYYDISVIRRHYASICGADVSTIEGRVWKHIHSKALKSLNCVIESTGLSYRLGEIFMGALAERGIYTIKFIAPIKVCQSRARERSSSLSNIIKGYDLDEGYAIAIEDEYQQKAPANLIVNMSSWRNKIEKFKTVQEYIYKAKLIYYKQWPRDILYLK